MKIENNTIYNMDCIEGMKLIPDNSIDAIVTDPPYELGFMGKKWDNTGIAYDVNLWKEALRVLKPGGHLLSFSSARTYHRMAVAIEDAGFEIRDMIEWVYGSGFPKSMNIGKAIEAKLKTGKSNSKALRQVEQEGDGEEYTLKGRNNGIMGEERVYNRKEFIAEEDEAIKYQGWGTALKPAHEPIVMARKPIAEKTIAENVMEWGTAGINIDKSRIGTDELKQQKAKGTNGGCYGEYNTEALYIPNTQGRFPANFIISEDIAPVLDEQSGHLKSGYMSNEKHKRNKTKGEYQSPNGIYGKFELDYLPETYGDQGGASRFYKNIEEDHLDDITPFFYCAKASKKERNLGLEDEPDKTVKITNMYEMPRKNGTMREIPVTKNNHPTVKPIKLMRYLINLITPDGGVVLDPFMGSGTTALAALYEEKDYIGFEMEEEYCEIINKRIEGHQGGYLN